MPAKIVLCREIFIGKSPRRVQKKRDGALADFQAATPKR